MGGPVVPRVTVHQITAAGGVAKLIVGLVETVRANPQMELREKAVAALRSLAVQQNATESASNPVLIAETGLPPLVELLKSGSTLAQTHAAATLAIVSRCSEAHPLAIAKLGGIEYLVGILRSGANSAQEQAAATVASISRVAANQLPIIQAGAIAPLVQLLKTGSSEAQMHAAEAVGNLARQPEGQELVQKANGIPKLLVLLGSGAGVEVARALALLAHENESIQKEVCMLDGIAQLLALLSGINTDAQAMASLAIAELASGANGKNRKRAQDAIAKAGGIGPLLQLIESRYPLVVCESVNAIAMVARGNRANQEIIASMGGIKPLVELSQASRGEHALAFAAASNHYAPDKAFPVAFVAAEAAGALWSLSEGHDANKVSIAGSQAIPTLVGLLGSPNERAQRHGGSALVSLSIGQLENQEQVSQLLVELLSTTTDATQKRAAKTLWRVVKDNSQHEVAIAKAGGADNLVLLLRDAARKPSTQEAKAYALWALSLCIDETNHAKVSEAGGIPPLVATLVRGDVLQKEQAACALAKLGRYHDDARAAIARAGGVEPLISLLDRCNADASELSQQHAAAALSELAQLSSNKRAIERAGGISPLVALLWEQPADQPESVESKRHAAAALARLSSEDPVEVAAAAAKALKEANADEDEAERGDEAAAERIRQRHYTKEHEKKKPSLAEQVAEAGAIAPLVKLLSGSKSTEAQAEAAGALWALADHAINRLAITENGGIGPLVALLGCEDPSARKHAEGALVRLSIEISNRSLIIKQLVSMLYDSGTGAQEQAAAALANLARDSTDNRTSIVDAGGIPPLLALMRSSSNEAKEKTLQAITQLAHNSAPNQLAIAAAGGIPLLVQVLTTSANNSKEVSAMQLCALAACAVWRMTEANPANQEAMFKAGVIVPLVSVLASPVPEMQSNAAAAIASLARDNTDNQAAIARAGGIVPLCTLVRDGSPDTKDQSASALWALASNNAPNKATIAKLGGIEPLVGLLMYAQSETSSINAAGALSALAAQHSDNRLAITKRLVAVLSMKATPARATRLLSALAALCDSEPTNQVAIAKAGGVQHLIVWLSNPDEGVQTQAARAMLAVASNNMTTQALVNRDPIARAGAISPLIKLLSSTTLGTPETAARALAHLARDSDDLAHPEVEGETGGETSADATGVTAVADTDARSSSWMRRDDNDGGAGADDGEDGSAIVGGEARRALILFEGGVKRLVAMLDGSNLPSFDAKAAGSGWAKARIGVAGTIELAPIFPGSQVDFGVRIGMQEQGAATLADLAQADEAMQDAIISAGAVRPLLELTRLGSPVAQEHAARVIVGLCEQIDNQRIMVAGGAIFDLTMLLKHGSAHAMEAAAAAISSLCRNAVLAIERKGINLADLREEMSGAISSGSPSRAAHAARAQSKADSAAEAPPSEVAAAAAEMPPAELEEEGSEEREEFRRQLIADAGGIIPLVKLLETGTVSAKEKGGRGAHNNPRTRTPMYPVKRLSDAETENLGATHFQ
ncbi:beta-glucan synthesis-associated [Chrysochromulina tobinii]|uniref:Beta-glucan synthesis-associated n=1 Tax=Chrysochromulina tobinii TaxID=1460289 RepID=A0A0M0JNA1_9EUKA|nr:beta-glucan synthesis-associated [Chrysochromulina tobinii]|eukprot:KOO28054.1 beta-glucan synthesis-associated [Chrysochromulina sp. CCMP291]